MNPRAARLALVALALSGCTLSDGRDDVDVVLTSGSRASTSLSLQIRASPGAKASIRVDGVDRGSFRVNVPISLDTSLLAEGSHTLRVTVLDGPYSERSIERSFLVDRGPPTCKANGPSPGTPGSDLVVTVVYSEPVDPASVTSIVEFFSRGVTLPTGVAISPDGRVVTARLQVPLDEYPSVGLRTNVRDLAGNPARMDPDCFREWVAPVSPLTVAAPDEVDGSLTASVSLPAGWTGPTGPITARLCSRDPNGLDIALVTCVDAGAPGPGELTFDTSGLRSQGHFLVAKVPGYRFTDARVVKVLHRSLTVDLSASRTITNGPVVITVAGDGGFPPALEILVGGTVFATVPRSAASGSFRVDVPWDAGVPEGVYGLGARAADWLVIVNRADSIRVDRTPPVATPAWPSSLDFLDASRVAVTFSEPVTGTTHFRLDGAIIRSAVMVGPATEVSYPYIAPMDRPWTDGVLEYDVSAMTDLAGNPAGPARAASTVPVWRSPAGPAPLESAGVPIVATEAVALWSYVGPEQDLRLAFIDPQGQVRAGRLSGLLPDPVGTAGSGLLANGFGSLEFTAAWMTASPSTVVTTSVGTSTSTPLASASVTAPASPLRSGARAQPYMPRLTWTEPDGAGSRTVRFQAWDGRLLTAQPDLPTTAVDAVEECCAGAPFAAARWAVLAWIDGAAAVPQLALSTSPAGPFGYPGGPWSVLSASANADRAQPASEPALYHEHVAWIEGGRVRAGRLAVQAGAPVFVPDDPASVPGSRLVRFLELPDYDETILIFVEPGRGGDIIAARRRTASTGWQRLSPVTTGWSGEVRSLAADRDIVTWTDAAGHVYARRLNR